MLAHRACRSRRRPVPTLSSPAKTPARLVQQCRLGADVENSSGGWGFKLGGPGDGCGEHRDWPCYCVEDQQQTAALAREDSGAALHAAFDSQSLRVIKPRLVTRDLGRGHMPGWPGHLDQATGRDKDSHAKY